MLPVVAHVPGRLAGDEDDDDNPVKRTGSERDFDSDPDGDYKDSYTGYFDRDDGPIRGFGHQAGASEKRAIAKIVKRYLAAAAAGDGVTACAMLYRVFEGAIAEDYGQPPAPSYLRGNTCAAVMTKAFRYYHARVAGPVEIVSIRVRGVYASVLLGSASLPASSINLRREGGAWKVDSLFPSALQ